MDHERKSPGSAQRVLQGPFVGSIALSVVSALYLVLGAVEFLLYPNLNFDWFGQFPIPVSYVIFFAVIILPTGFLTVLLIYEVTLPHPQVWPIGLGLLLSSGIIFWFLGYLWLLILGALYIVGVAVVLSITTRT